MVANPARGSRLKIWSRDTGSAVPPRVSLLILHTFALFNTTNTNVYCKIPPCVGNEAEHPGVPLSTALTSADPCNHTLLMPHLLNVATNNNNPVPNETVMKHEPTLVQRLPTAAI